MIIQKFNPCKVWIYKKTWVELLDSKKVQPQGWTSELSKSSTVTNRYTPWNHLPMSMTYDSLRDGNYLIFKDAPKIETIKAGLKYIDINVLRRFSAILHCNGISSHFNIRRSLSSDSYINKSTAKHFTNLGRETFVYLLSPNLSISQGTWKHFKIKS